MDILKELRQKKGVYQKDVAKYLGVDRTTYVKYERGNSEPSNDILIKLADYFNISVDCLLGRNIKFTSNKINDFNLNAVEKQIILDYRDLSEQGQYYIRETMEMAKDRYKKDLLSADTKVV